MGQQTLIYSFVARGTVILAEYTEFKGNFISIASQCLQKLPATYDKFTYNSDGHAFHYLSHNGFTYCIVAVESAGVQLPIACLERIKEDFTTRYGGGKAATAVANSLNIQFGPKLKEQMQYCVDHPEEISQLAKVKAQVDEVKGVMIQTMDTLLDRGVKIDVLEEKAGELHSQAQGFKAGGTALRRKMWTRNMKIKLIASLEYYHCLDSHHSVIRLRWLPLLFFWSIRLQRLVPHSVALQIVFVIFLITFVLPANSL